MRASLTAAVSAALLLASGCAVKAPLPSSWALAPPTRAASLTPSAPALGVARFSSAAEVRTTDLTWRSEDGRLLHATDDRWAEYPDRMVEEVVRRALLASGRFSAVSAVPPSNAVDTVLEARLLDFTEWHAGEGIEVRVSLEWHLRRPSGEVLTQQVTSAAVPLPARSVAGAVKAYQDAVDDVATRLSDAVAAAAAAAGAREESR